LVNLADGIVCLCGIKESEFLVEQAEDSIYFQDWGFVIHLCGKQTEKNHSPFCPVNKFLD